MSPAPILDNKAVGAPSLFEPAALLRVNRRGIRTPFSG